MTIRQRHRDRARQNRHHGDQQIGGDQPGPGKHRHLHQRHAGSAHVQDGGDDVDRAHDRRSTHDVHRENTHVHADAHLRGERRIEGPACSGCAAGHQERRDEQDRSGWQQPEREVVHPRKRHIGRADLQRDHPVRETDEGRHDRAEHHDQTMHGGQLVEEFRLEQLQAGLEQLGTNAQCEDATGQQHREREPQVQSTDVLVVGRVQPAAPAVRMMIVVRVVCVTVCVIKGCAHVFLLISRLLARSQDFGGLNDVVRCLVRPGVAGISNNRSDLGVGQRSLPCGHAILAIQQNADLAFLRTVHHL